MIRKYHNHKIQTNLCHFKEESQTNHQTPGRQKSKAISFQPAKHVTKACHWGVSAAALSKKSLEHTQHGPVCNLEILSALSIFERSISPIIY